MTKSEIKKISLVVAEIPDVLPSVANEALEILGYHSENIEASKPNPLENGLRELDIQILDWRNVRQYCFERWMEHEAERHQRSIQNDEVLPEHYWPSRWEFMEISKYKRWIPDFILPKAVEIKKAFPEVEIGVFHLDETPDPFLVARIDNGKYGHFTYYIDVWDEPRFEQI